MIVAEGMPIGRFRHRLAGKLFLAIFYL